MKERTFLLRRHRGESVTGVGHDVGIEEGGDYGPGEFCVLM